MSKWTIVPDISLLSGWLLGGATLAAGSSPDNVSAVLRSPRAVEHLELGEPVEPPRAVLDADAAPLPAAEGLVRREDGVRVHPGRARLELAGDGRRAPRVGAPDRAAEPELRRVRVLERVVEVAIRDHRERRPELLVGHEVVDSLELRPRRDRADADAVVHAVRDLDRAGALGERGDDVVVEALRRVDPLDPRADLAAVVEGAPEEAVCERDGVDVVEQDRRVVAAELEGDTLEVGRRRGRDVLAGRDRAGEADLPWDRVRAHPLAELVAAADDVQHAGRKERSKELGEPERRQRRERRRLEDDGVPGAERGRDLPEGEREREVPGRDRRDDAERAPDDLDERVLVVLDDLPGQLELGEVAQPGCARPDLCERLPQRLSLLLREHLRELVRRRLDRFRRGGERRPARRLVGAPAAEGGERGVHRLVELLAARRRRERERLAGRGVEDLEVAGAADGAAGDRHREGRRHVACAWTSQPLVSLGPA